MITSLIHIYSYIGYITVITLPLPQAFRLSVSARISLDKRFPNKSFCINFESIRCWHNVHWNVKSYFNELLLLLLLLLSLLLSLSLLSLLILMSCRALNIYTRSCQEARNTLGSHTRLKELYWTVGNYA